MWKPSAEPTQQGELRTVTNRLADGECSHRNVESQDRADRDECRVGHLFCLPELDPAYLRGGQPDELTGPSLRKAGRRPRLADLVAEPGECLARPVSSSIQTPLASRHAKTMTAGAYPGLHPTEVA
jgi:hypothetical protein